MPEYKNKEEEFFDNVWNHTDDVFQKSFDDRRHLNKEEINFLDSLKKLYTSGTKGKTFSSELRKILKQNEVLFPLLLQLLGLTRNKILQDLKAMSGIHRKKLKLSNFKKLIDDNLTWEFSNEYLKLRIDKVLGALFFQPSEHAAYESLNQATWPGFIRQERAKRSGHEAERKMALILEENDIPFVPKEKLENPLCNDVQIKDVSFDIVIPNIETPLICVKSTVHTANIGQYGESKDHLEISEARLMIDKEFNNPRIKPKLIGLIDGVGFESNKAGLLGVLKNADEFCQFKTMWKIIIVALFLLGRKADIYVPQKLHEKHKEFFHRYLNKNLCLSKVPFSEKDKDVIVMGECMIKHLK